MANALFGRLGEGTTIQNTSKATSGMDQLFPVNMPQLNTGTQQAQPNDLQSLLSGGGNIASKALANWGGGKINDYLFGPKTFEGLSPAMQGFADNYAVGAPADAYKTLASQFGLESEGGELLKKGIYDKLLQKAVTESSDDILTTSANAAATQSIPWVGPALGLGKDILSGNILRQPGGSIGSAGGALGGAMLGQALIPIPGLGAAIGGLLGGTGGGFLGRTIGRLFR
jgi:hypothetical protein